MASPQGGSEPLLADTRPSGLRQPLDLGRARKAGAGLGTEGAAMVRRAMRFHRRRVIIAFEHPIEIGRAACRERVCQYVWISVVAVSFKQKTAKQKRKQTG